MAVQRTEYGSCNSHYAEGCETRNTETFCHQKTEQIKYIKVLMNPLKIDMF